VKICLIAPSLLAIPPEYGGAIETFTYELGLSLANLKNQVFILSKNGITKQIRINPNLTIYYLHIPNNSLVRGLLYNIKVLFKLIEFRSIDILHTQATAVFPVTYLISKLFEIPIIHTEHIAYPWIKTPFMTKLKAIKYPFEQVLGKFTVGKADKIVVSNYFMQKAMGSIKQKLESKFEIIPQGIDTKIFNLNVNRTIIRKKYNVSDDDILLLYIGRIVPEKNIELLIKTVSKLKNKYRNIKLMLVGPRSPRYQTSFKSEEISTYYLELKQWINRQNLQDSIIFAGSTPYRKIPYFYAASDMLIQPSPLETFGRALFEAASMGIPFIATQIGEAPPAYLPKSTSVFIKKMNLQTLSSAIEEIVNNGDKFRINGINAAKKIHTQYAWEEIAKFYLKIYKNLVKNSDKK
jgi:glycosyltransferase involved in cell wall biosynthesis